jgi:hypothetical protein
VCWGVKKAAAATSEAEPARLQLWREDAVRELLRPATMRLGAWLSVENLQAFLSTSQQPSFPYEQQWSRLLSLELALREAHG